MNFNKKYLPKSDVVFTVMFLNKELCERTLQAILGESIEWVDIVAESKNDMHKAALNAIYFDIKTKAVDRRIVTLDLQRKYIKDRVRNRTVYYACREISSQEVKHGKYENLKNVIITFLLTEASLKHTSDDSCIVLKNNVTNELYTSILTIHEVNIKHIDDKNAEELQILKRFFEIENQSDFDKFSHDYGNTDYGKLLLNSYIETIREDTLLDSLEKEDKYMIRLTDEERLQEREEGRQEGIEQGKKQGMEQGRKQGMEQGRKQGMEQGEKNKALEIALNLLSRNMPLFDISQITGLSEKEIQQLKSSI